MRTAVLGIKYVCDEEKLRDIARYTDSVMESDYRLLVDVYRVGVELLKPFLTEKDLEQIQKEGISLILFINANADLDDILLM